MPINKLAIFDGNIAQNINNESNQLVEKTPESNMISNSEPAHCCLPEDYGKEKHEFNPTQRTLFWDIDTGLVIDEEFYINLILSHRYNSTRLPNHVKEVLLEHPELLQIPQVQ